MNRPTSARAACTALLAAALAGVGMLSAQADQGHDAVDAAAQGAAIYQSYCSVCHGDRGDANSRARGSLQPPPRDFTSPEARLLSRESMIAAVTVGRADTAMAPWSEQLSAAQIEAVVDYIRNTFMAPRGLAPDGEGARLYSRTCSVCHGDNGSGAVWATTNLSPRPRDFTTARASAELSRDRMIHSVTFGRPDTAMPGFGTQLEKAQIEAVVDYVRSRFMHVVAAPGEGEHARHGHGERAEPAASGAGHDHYANLTAAGADSSVPFDGGLVGNSERGEELYRQNCVACHGEQGNGQGPRAYFILPKPRNFTHPAARSALNRPHLYEAIARGRVGSEMPAWDTVLDAQSIADIAEYVFQRFILGRSLGSAEETPAVAAR